MANRLDDTDRDLLNFRPDIDYIEPEVQPGVITPVSKDLPQLEDVLNQRRRVMKLAQAVDILATFMQARADEKAKDMVINLDPKIDAGVIQAMKRRFPGADPYRITYPQYRECKGFMKDAGQSIARKANVTPEQINVVREDAVNMLGGGTVRDSSVNLSTTDTDGTDDGLDPSATTSGAGNTQGSSKSKGTGAGLNIGGFDTEKAKTGGLRPELDTNMRIVEPLDIGEMQYSLICILVNFIWKNFVLKAFGFKILGKKISSLLPKKLCDSGSVEAPDLILLGGEIPKLFTQKPASLGDTAPEVEE